MLGEWVDGPSNPATQSIILKIVGLVELELVGVVYERSKHSPESEAFQFLAFGHWSLILNIWPMVWSWKSTSHQLNSFKLNNWSHTTESIP